MDVAYGYPAQRRHVCVKSCLSLAESESPGGESFLYTSTGAQDLYSTVRRRPWRRVLGSWVPGAHACLACKAGGEGAYKQEPVRHRSDSV